MNLAGILRKSLQTKTAQSAVTRYVIAVAVVAVATGGRLALNPILGRYSPYLPFTLAVLVAARFGGRAPGFAATALSALGVAWFFIAPFHSLAIANSDEGWGLALFILVGALISLIAGRLRESLALVTRSEAVLQRHAQLIEHSHDAVITTDSDRRIVTWNAGAVQIYGWSEAEAVGKVTHEFLKTTGTMSTTEIDDILRRNQQWDGELNHSTRDGRRIVVESRQVLVRDENSRRAGILEINRDVTERKNAEAALQQSEAQFRTLANAIPNLCWIANSDGWIFWYNQRWYEYTGTTPEQMEGWGWQSVHDPDVLPEVLHRWKASIANEKPFDMIFPLRGADGVFRPFLTRVVPVRDQEGKVARWFGTNTDVSEQRRNEEALRQAYEQRGLALDAANLGSWDYRFDTGDVFWDDRCRNLWGVPVGDQIDYNDAIARIHPEDRSATEEAVKQAIAGANGGAYYREFRVVWPDGSVHWVSSHGQVFFEGQNDQRRAVRFVGVNMETTDRRMAEERLRKAQKLESIGLLAGGVAHDFNNLLTVIMGSASSALQECPTCEHSQAVLEASGRAAYLTKQLLAYAGKGQFVTKAIDLTDLVERSQTLLAASIPKRVSLTFNLSKDLPPLEGDPSRIEQILVNLVINAAEAIPPKTDGWIEIATSSCEVTPGIAREHSDTFEVQTGPHVCLEVMDNGVGMEQSTISRIFDPFFTTKFTGRGLGLAAVHGIVRGSKGFIEVHSHPGSGSTFRVYFPTSEKELAAEGPRSGSPWLHASTAASPQPSSSLMTRRWYANWRA